MWGPISEDEIVFRNWSQLFGFFGSRFSGFLGPGWPGKVVPGWGDFVAQVGGEKWSQVGGILGPRFGGKSGPRWAGFWAPGWPDFGSEVFGLFGPCGRDFRVHSHRDHWPYVGLTGGARLGEIRVPGYPENLVPSGRDVQTQVGRLLCRGWSNRWPRDMFSLLPV